MNRTRNGVVTIIILLLVCLATFDAFAGGTKEQPGTAESKPKGLIGEGIVVGYTTLPVITQYWANVKKYAEEAAARLGVKLVHLTGKSNDVSQQLDIINDYITQKVDGVVISAADGKGIIPGVEKLNAAGIPVVGADSVPQGGEMIAKVQVDGYVGGRLLGEYIFSKKGPNGKVFGEMPETYMEVSYKRKYGAFDFLKEKGWSILQQPLVPRSRAGSMELAETILLGNKDLKAYLGGNDEYALGAMKSIINQGRKSEVMLAGYDCLPEALEAIKRGDMDCTIFQDAKKLVNWAIEQIIHYKYSQWPGTLVYLMPPVLVTRENAAEIEAKYFKK